MNFPFQISCPKHPDFNIQFLQINEIYDGQDKSIFYCIECSDEDSDYKSINYILIQKLIQSTSKQVLPKWPPLSNKKISENLIKQTGNNQSIDQIEKQINEYFDQLNFDITQKLNEAKNKMNHQAQSIKQQKNEILETYQELSKLGTFQQIFKEENSNVIEKERKIKSLLEQLLSKKDENTQILENLLNQIPQPNYVHFEYSNIIKSEILSQIDQIDLFKNKKDVPQKLNLQMNLEEQINKMIENENQMKSSDDSIQELNRILNEKNNDIRGYNFSNLHENDFETVVKLAIHLEKFSTNMEYLTDIKGSNEIQQIKKVLANKTNFLRDDFKIKFEDFLIQTYPLLFSTLEDKIIFQDFQKIDTFINLNETALQNFDLLSNKKVLQEEKSIFDKTSNSQSKQSKEPSFVNVNPNNSLPTNIIAQMDFKQSTLNSGLNPLTINNTIRIQATSNNYYTQCISTNNLIQNSKYTFRFKINCSQDGQKIGIGLTYSNQTSNKALIYNMDCLLTHKKGELHVSQNCGISQIVKGQYQLLNCKTSLLELRISQTDSLIEVTDYPHYSSLITLQDKYKMLPKQDNLKLFIYLGSSSKVLVTEAMIVSNFN